MRAPAQPVPGRLRLSFTQLKQRPEQLDRMAASLGAVNGVLAVDTSSLSGSLLIQFDSVVGNTPAFWDQIESVLHAFELMLNPRPFARMGSKGGGAGSAGHGDKAAHTSKSDPNASPISVPTVAIKPTRRDFARALMDKLMERTSIALVTALAR